MSKKVLVSGGMGFVGHHVVEGVLKNTDWEIVILDRLDVSGNPNRLIDIEIWEQEKHRVSFVWWDLKAEVNDSIKSALGNIDYIWHLAAGSHVDRSIEDPLSFVYDNVVATTNLLNYARSLEDLKLFIYFSTDEVFGSAPEGVSYKEWDRYNSGNPYSASKAGGEEMALAFANTYKLPVIITHSMNIFGERQHPEKYIPLCIRKIVNGETITIHSNAEKTQAGKRHYLHARNITESLIFLTRNGETVDGSGERGKYNIVGDEEVDNLTLAQMIADILDKPLHYEMLDFHSSRPGHDLRYALDGSLLAELGFNYPKDFKGSLEKTVQWYTENPQWLS